VHSYDRYVNGRFIDFSKQEYVLTNKVYSTNNQIHWPIGTKRNFGDIQEWVRKNTLDFGKWRWAGSSWPDNDQAGSLVMKGNTYPYPFYGVIDWMKCPSGVDFSTVQRAGSIMMRDLKRKDPHCIVVGTCSQAIPYSRQAVRTSWEEHRNRLIARMTSNWGKNDLLEALEKRFRLEMKYKKEGVVIVDSFDDITSLGFINAQCGMGQNVWCKGQSRTRTHVRIRTPHPFNVLAHKKHHTWIDSGKFRCVLDYWLDGGRDLVLDQAFVGFHGIVEQSVFWQDCTNKVMKLYPFIFDELTRRLHPRDLYALITTCRDIFKTYIGVVADVDDKGKFPKVLRIRPTNRHQ
jgi:hypothetical protein